MARLLVAAAAGDPHPRVRQAAAEALQDGRGWTQAVISQRVDEHRAAAAQDATALYYVFGRGMGGSTAPNASFGGVTGNASFLEVERSLSERRQRRQARVPGKGGGWADRLKKAREQRAHVSDGAAITFPEGKTKSVSLDYQKREGTDDIGLKLYTQMQASVSLAGDNVAAAQVAAYSELIAGAHYYFAQFACVTSRVTNGEKKG